MEDTLITLLSDALHEKKGTWLPKSGELNQLLVLAVKHGVAGALIEALPKEAMPCVQSLEATLHAVDMLQENEGVVLLRRMAEHTIPCVPLKGWVLREDYPRPHMRTMGDLDIVIPPDRLTDVEQIMMELGYSREREPFTDYHVCYYKEPCLTVEIHLRLTEEEYSPLFDTVWERTTIREDGCFQLSDEDTYLFLIYHAAKHVRLGGIGLRYIMDLWVLLHRFAHATVTIQREQIEQGLKQLGLTSFAAYSEQLAAEWFSVPGLSLATVALDSEAMHLWKEFIISSGAFGGAVSSYENQMAERSGPVLVAAKLFPCKELMEIRYPIIREKPWRLPQFWFVRLWKKILSGEASTGALALASVSRLERERRKYLLRQLELL